MPEPNAPLARRASPVFLILGMAFLAAGLAADNITFTWISLAFLALSLVAGGRWLRKKRP